MTKAEFKIPISPMAAAVQPSATLAAGAKARQMKAEGIHVYDFSLGEPDFPTPEHICQAAVKAMEEGHTHYTPASGIAELRAAIARGYQKAYGLPYTAEQVIVSNGAKHSLHNALAATVGPGDEVIIPTPYWVSYSDLVQMTGANYVLVPTTLESGFKMTPAQLQGRPDAAEPAADAQFAEQSDRHRLHPRRSWKRWPTWSSTAGHGRPQRRDLRAAGLRRRQGDLFRHAAAGPGRADHHHQRRQQELCHDRLAHGLGAGAGARHQGDGQRAEPGNELSVQHQPVRRLAALEGDQECVEKMRREFEARRDLVCQRLANMPGVACPAAGRRVLRLLQRRPPTSAGRWPAAGDGLGWLLPGRLEVGPRQPGAGLGLRRRGLRSAVVRHQPRAD